VLDHERPFVSRQRATEAVEAVTPDGVASQVEDGLRLVLSL
jgi:hypothetical protein